MIMLIKVSQIILTFLESGHRIADFSFTVLEKVHKICPEYLRKSVEHWIKKFNTKHKGTQQNKLKNPDKG